MKKIYTVALGFFVPLFVSAKEPALGSMQNSPFTFIENKGQVTDQYSNPRPDIQYKLSSPDVNVFIGNAQLHYQWMRTRKASANIKKGESPEMAAYRMDVSLVSANTAAQATAEEPEQYYERYFKQEFNKDGTIAHSCRKITYKDIYPNIDWVISIDNTNAQEGLIYDFVVHPGGNPGDIQLQYSGASSLELNKDGSITATTPMGKITEHAPYSYTTTENNARTVVASNYVLHGNTLGFTTGSYTGTLIIDPSLTWSTYYGGTSFADLGSALSTDPSGNIYITGTTYGSTNIATTGAAQATFGGGSFKSDAFLVKFNRSGIRIWGTFYGGNKNDDGSGVACDGLNAVYLSGQTSTASSTSPNAIATAGSFKATLSGTSSDVFLARFDSSGARVWGTYYGGTTVDNTGICAIDKKGHVYLGGTTSNMANIASSNGFDTTYGAGEDAFLVQFDTAGNRQWATYYGGAAEDEAFGIACDSHGNVYLNGMTASSNDIASTGSYQSSYSDSNDVFIAKFNSAGARQWATYYGGTGNDIAGGYAYNTIACNVKDEVYIVGATTSPNNIASVGAYQTSIAVAGDRDAFVAKFDSLGNRKWGTYFGGTDYENAAGVATDAAGDILVCGNTASATGIASGNAFQYTLNGTQDAYLVCFDTAGARRWGSYFGGSDNDEAYGVACDNAGNIYLTGDTPSPDIATPNAFDTSFLGNPTIYLARICSAIIPASSSFSGNDSVCAHTAQTYSITSSNDTAITYLWTLPSGFTGISTTNTIHVVTGNTSGAIMVNIIKCNDTSKTIAFYVTVLSLTPVVVHNNGLVLSTTSTYYSYQWYLNGTVIPNATQANYTATQNGVYTIKVGNAYGCTDSSSVGDTISNVSVTSLEQVSKSTVIYPNPATNIIHIMSPVAVTVSISSLQGQQLITKNNVSAVNIGDLANGVYMIRITDSNGTLIKTEKLVKMN